MTTYDEAVIATKWLRADWRDADRSRQVFLRCVNALPSELVSHERVDVIDAYHDLEGQLRALLHLGRQMLVTVAAREAGVLLFGLRDCALQLMRRLAMLRAHIQRAQSVLNAWAEESPDTTGAEAWFLFESASIPIVDLITTLEKHAASLTVIDPSVFR